MSFLLEIQPPDSIYTSINTWGCHQIGLVDALTQAGLDTSAIEININPGYTITQEDLLDYLFIAGNPETTQLYSLPKTILSRGRETGRTDKAVILSDKSGYGHVGCLLTKGLSLRWLLDAQYFKAKTKDPNPIIPGLTLFDEMFLETYIGDTLEDMGAHIGITIATLKISFRDLKQMYSSQGVLGQRYAEILSNVMSAKHLIDDDLVCASVRLTDPTRIDCEYFAFFDEDGKLLPESFDQMVSSYLWLKEEFEFNQYEKFKDKFNVPEQYIRHFQKPTDKISTNDMIEHAKFLLFVISRNFAQVMKTPFDAWFDQKDIGNLGRLHDFAISLDFMDMKPDHFFTIESFKNFLDSIKNPYILTKSIIEAVVNDAFTSAAYYQKNYADIASFSIS